MEYTPLHEYRKAYQKVSGLAAWSENCGHNDNFSSQYPVEKYFIIFITSIRNVVKP
jgi:hypothetical protein